ncbi:uncharacterized protein TNCV_1815521 [Trichonephila clavipes]|nr:uncharacterized protein TNCV_1815521 [Trichonephila clavipes]
MSKLSCGKAFYKYDNAASEQKNPGKPPTVDNPSPLYIPAFYSCKTIGCRHEAIVHSENENGRCGDRFTKKSVEKTVRLHKHVYGIHVVVESNERYAWLQQDGATCNTSWDSAKVLTKFFDDRIISKDLWPPRLPDLSI